MAGCVSDDDLDFWIERSAIMEYCGGMSRFQAETEAAKMLGETRWRMIDADRKRNTGIAPDRGKAAKRDNQGEMPGVQCNEEKQK